MTRWAPECPRPGQPTARATLNNCIVRAGRIVPSWPTLATHTEDLQLAAEPQLIPLARAYAELEAADMICRRAAALFDVGKECGADANMAKLSASKATWHAAEATFSAYGGFAFAREYDIERKWREARLYQTAPISTNLILAYLGQHVLGMPRSY
jgi:alkylation response protein AidB-like acyl-CoA dehydrogenase